MAPVIQNGGQYGEEGKPPDLGFGKCRIPIHMRPANLREGIKLSQFPIPGSAKPAISLPLHLPYLKALLPHARRATNIERI